MTKIDIISGFLGAGKTTLIKKLLAEAYQGEKLVLIENEFGEISIDGGFLKDSGVQVSEMSSGCICCSLVGDFNKALKEVHQQFQPDRILIEPSGVGKLSDVIRAVQALHAAVELAGFVTVADASKCRIYMKNFGEFYNNQIESAGTIILSRTQKMTQEKLEAAVALLREKNPTAAILTTPWDQLDGMTILSAIEKVSLADELLAHMRAEHEADEAEHEHEHHHHHHDEDEHDHDHCCHHHDHDDDDDDDHDHEHCCHHHHDEDEDDHDHDHLGTVTEIDEHVWTAPANAAAITRQFGEVLAELDSANGERYRANAEKYAEEIDTLDGEFHAFFDSLPDRTIVFGDRFPLRYFAEEFDLRYYAAFPGCSTQTEPSAATIAFLTDKVREEGISTVWYIEFSNHLVADAIAEAAKMPSQALRMVLVVFIVVPIACAYPFFQRYIVAGLTVGSVKG